MDAITRHIYHGPAVRSLYRELLRKTKTINKLKIPAVSEKIPPEIVDEIKAANDDSEYLDIMQYEVRYTIQEAMRGQYKRVEYFREKYCQAIDLIKILEALDFIQLLQFCKNYRDAQAARNQRLYEHYKVRGITDFKEKLTEDVTSKFAWPVDHIKSLSNDERVKRIDKEILQSQQHKNKLLRKYLKILQMNNKLAVPALLPYTELPLPAKDIKLSSKIYDSTATTEIKEAYNHDIIEAVLLPELEHDINYKEYLLKLELIVNNKGPYEVKIRSSSAGPTAVPFLRLPFPQLAKMRTIALDIKRLIQASEILNLWEPSKNMNLSEKMNGDGSVNIGWAKKYGRKATMFTKAQNKKLYDSEANWEFLMDLELAKSKKAKRAYALKEDSYKTSWSQALEDTSRVLREESRYYQRKYNDSFWEQLESEQAVRQEQMDAKYNIKVEKYDRIQSILQEKNVTAHADLISEPVTEYNIDRQMLKDDNSIKWARKGVQLYDRRGRGKRISEYMDDVNLSSFKIGMKYGEKLSFLRGEGEKAESRKHIK